VIVFFSIPDPSSIHAKIAVTLAFLLFQVCFGKNLSFLSCFLLNKKWDGVRERGQEKDGGGTGVPLSP
jgi:hypothetical protein